MREFLRVHQRSGLLLVLALAILSVGACFCPFNAHDHHASHAVSFDLCLGAALVAVAALGFISLLLHALPLDPPYVFHAVSLHTPDPPPKLFAHL
jgi:acyl-CoA synthetase (AMP-forming)/AMP-acid ligase II